MITPAQAALRQTGIGSSDIAAIIGRDPRRGRLHVFNEKVFAVQQQGNPSTDYGSCAQWGIVAYRANELGGRLWTAHDYKARFGENLLHVTDHLFECGALIRHPERPLAMCSPDGIVEVPGEPQPIGVEAKNVAFDQSADWGDDDDDVPEHYWLQCQWQMGVTGIKRWNLTAAIGGRAPATWDLAFDPKTFDDLYLVASDFWAAHVATKMKPGDIDESDASTDYLRAAYPRETSDRLAKATPEEEADALKYVWATEQIVHLEAVKQGARNRLCEAIGNRVGVYLTDGRRVTWKYQPNGDKKPTRVLRVSKGR